MWAMRMVPFFCATPAGEKAGKLERSQLGFKEGINECVMERNFHRKEPRLQNVGNPATIVQ